MEKYSQLINKIEWFCALAEAKEKAYGPYVNGPLGRKIMIIVSPDGTRRTVSLPKYLMEQHLGIELKDRDMTVDHWDTNKENNSIENLRLIPRDLHSAQDTKRVKLIDLECAQCKNNFQRSPRLIRDKSNKGSVSQFCSRSCAGKYSRDVQLGKREKLPVQEPPKSEYFKRKYVDSLTPPKDETEIESLASAFEEKYFLKI